MTTSPFYEFDKWLFDGNIKSELDSTVLKIMSPLVVICKFNNCGQLTLFLNKYFNNFDITKINKLDLFLYLKKLVILLKIKRYDSTFIKLSKEKTISKDIMKEFPLLKDYEISTFFELAKNDPEIKSLEESIGLNNTKIKKSRRKKDE
jgi:hypothetical protein